MLETRLITTIRNAKVKLISPNLFQIGGLPVEYGTWYWRTMRDVRSSFTRQEMSEPVYESFRPEYVSRYHREFAWVQEDRRAKTHEFWLGDIINCPLYENYEHTDVYVPKGWVKEVKQLRYQTIIYFDEAGRAMTSHGAVGVYTPPAAAMLNEALTD
jgi:hypothetical protein